MAPASVVFLLDLSSCCPDGTIKREVVQGMYYLLFTLVPVFVHSCSGLEQICGRIWSFYEMAKLIFESGEGFVIDYDGGTTPFDWAHIVDWVIDLLLFVYKQEQVNHVFTDARCGT